MMGLRLRYQISGFLFTLFAIVVLIMGYFNISILNEQLRMLSLEKSKSTAENVYQILNKMVPSYIEDLDEFIRRKKLFSEFQKYTLTVDTLRNIELYDPDLKLLYSRLAHDEVRVDNKAILSRVKSEGSSEIHLWAVNPYDGTAQDIKTYGVMETRMLLRDFYFPIYRQAKIIGYVHLSIRQEKTSRLMKFFFVGNLSLSIVFIMTAFVAIFMWSENAINRPLRNLLRAQEQLSRGDFDAHVDIQLPANNELAVISNSFNQMAQELKAYKEELDEKTRKLELLNDQYRKLNENLEQEVENKTVELKEFFSLITHDLKIPLAAIRGYISLLKKTKTGVLTEKQAMFLDSIETSTLHLLNMVRNMLDSVKYDAGKVTYFMEKFDLFHLVKEVESHLHPIIKERSIDFSYNIPKSCQCVFGDRTKINQVISNIISNAIDYIPSGGKIELSAKEKGAVVEVMIEDNGPGIPPEQLSVIFEKFKQIPGKESPSTSLGLGLYIVRKIMEGHNMEAWAESEEGHGSKFYFIIKKAEEQDDKRNEENQGIDC